MIENSFGILAARWRLFRRPIIASPQRVRLYVQAAVALHNFLRTTESGVYCPPGFIDGEDGSGNLIDGGWRQDEETNSGMKSISQAGSNMCVAYCIINNIYSLSYTGTLGQQPRLETCTKITLALRLEKLLGNTTTYTEHHNHQ